MRAYRSLLCTVALLAACAAPATLDARSKKSGASGTTTSATMEHTGMTTGGGTGGNVTTPIPPLANPTLTRTSTSGTNPPTWDAVMPDMQDNDTVQLDFTSNGSAPDGTAEESHTIDATETAVTWSTFTGFAGSATVKWAERYGRVVSGTPVWSNWSNVLSDVMAAAVASPAGITGLKDYYQVRAAKLFTDTSCTVPVTADGDAVACWQPEIGTMGNWTQTTLAARPLYHPNGSNPYISFDGSNDSMIVPSTGLTTVTQPFYIAVAVKPASLGYHQVIDSSNGSNRVIIQTVNTPPDNWMAQAGTNVPNQGLTPTTSDAVYAALFNGASSKGRLDETDGTTVSIGTNVPASGLNLGDNNTNNGGWWSGRIYGFVIVNANPSSADKLQIDRWLGSLQGRTLP